MFSSLVSTTAIATRPTGAAALSASRPASRGARVLQPTRAAAGTGPGGQWLSTAPGQQAPTGPVWDPLGLATSPGMSVSEAKRYREAEVTHGRLAMLGSTGWLVAEKVHPLFGGDIEGPAFGHFQKVESMLPQFWLLLLLPISIAEAYRVSVGWQNPKDGLFKLKDDYTPGDLGFDPLGYSKDLTETELDELRTKELNNGRLAMVAVAGFAAQEGVNQTPVLKNFADTYLSDTATSIISQAPTVTDIPIDIPSGAEAITQVLPGL